MSDALHSTSNPCVTCGACCAAFRVTFYWAETDSAEGGLTPTELTNSLGPMTRCMKGTDTYSPRCIALEGEVGSATRCLIYPQRPSPCHAVEAGDEFCRKARRHNGLPENPFQTPPLAA